MFRSVLAGVVAAGVWGDAIQAQDCRADPVTPEVADSLAYRYSPILDFAAGEAYFPTLPFFAAFDGAESGNVGGFANVERIAPLDAGGNVSWKTLDSLYTAEFGRRRAPRTGVVFHRVRFLEPGQVQTLWTFLKNDPQAWKRLGARSYYEAGLKYACFNVIEYYFYYINDGGLQGHPNDIEKVFVFVPARRALADSLDRHRQEVVKAVSQARQQAGPDSLDALQGPELVDSLVTGFTVVVGAGHSTTTPNNVLVLTGQTARSLFFPYVLVELGGHSSAPNMPPYSEFNIGVDANWNIGENVWGTRDLQAISGLGYLGDYQPWFTVPRDPAASVNLKPFAADGALPGARTFVEESGWRLGRRIDTLTTAQVGRSGKQADPEFSGQYALLPVGPLQQLYAAATAFRADTARRDTLRPLIARLVDDSIGRLLPREWKVGSFASLDQAQADSAILRIALWDGKLHARNGKPVKQEHRIWRSEYFNGDPTGILKRSLYRPAMNSIRNAGDVGSLLTFGFAATLGHGGQQFQFGAVVPVFGGFASVPGILELQGGVYRPRFFESGGPTRISAALTYDRKYKQFVSWYARVQYVGGRAEIERSAVARDLDFGGGISLMPLLPIRDMLPKFTRGLAQALRVRAGVRIDFRDWEPSARLLDIQLVTYAR
jgi:hypothetical protein